MFTTSQVHYCRVNATAEELECRKDAEILQVNFFIPALKAQCHEMVV
jgi:hypothetical protein